MEESKIIVGAMIEYPPLDATNPGYRKTKMRSFRAGASLGEAIEWAQRQAAGALLMCIQIEPESL